MAAGSMWRFDAIGTVWEIETSAPLDDPARQAVRSLIDAFDRDWSRFRPDSLVSALARGAGAVAAPPDTAAMLDAYAALADATGGAVNPLVGASLERLGYDADVTLTAAGAPLAAPRDWRRQLVWTPDRITLSEPALLDVGALGKGRLVDRVLAVIAERTEGDVVVDAGGDLVARGAPVRVALEHPYDPARAIGVVEVADAALCASGSNRRAWGDGLHHVLDARTGEPVRTVVATWALCDSAMRADAIATALFFDGGERLAAQWGADWVRMFSDGRAEWSPGCPAEVFVRAG
ncbi:FAD:protein FMN transferase [Microbacterium sp.]|uniref:FAD:protein FMN transferase n=1 Tax=Microbacterium sp. TaxID=51671 RepID=UPI0037C91E38